MGNFEKIVVVVILLAAAGALAVSLNDSDSLGNEAFGKEATEEAEAAPGSARPMERGRTQPKTAASTQGAEPAPQGEAPTRSLPLLDAGEVPAPRPSELDEANDQGMPRILRSTRGLSASMMEEYKVYHPSPQDTWAGLAERFYRDARHVQTLRMANEGLDDLAGAQFILVPVYDLSAEAGERPSLRPLTRPEAETQPGLRTAPATAASATASAATGALAPEGGVEYRVVSGDSLSVISQKVYGTARRWREIYEANKDVLKSEHELQLDMKLYIPRAGEVSVPARPAATAQPTSDETKSTGKVR